MTLKQQLTEDMKAAMKARDALALGAIRFLQAEIRNIEIDHGEQDDAGIQKIISRQIKQMRDAIEEYKKGDRNDLVEAELAKMKVIEKYLPQQLSEDELKVLVEKVKKDNPAAQFGQLMGQVMKEAAGKADGGRVSAVIKQML